MAPGRPALHPTRAARWPAPEPGYQAQLTRPAVPPRQPLAARRSPWRPGPPPPGSGPLPVLSPRSARQNRAAGGRLPHTGRPNPGRTPACASVLSGMASTPGLSKAKRCSSTTPFRPDNVSAMSHPLGQSLAYRGDKVEPFLRRHSFAVGGPYGAQPPGTLIAGQCAAAVEAAEASSRRAVTLHGCPDIDVPDSGPCQTVSPRSAGLGVGVVTDELVFNQSPQGGQPGVWLKILDRLRDAGLVPYAIRKKATQHRFNAVVNVIFIPWGLRETRSISNGVLRRPQNLSQIFGNSPPAALAQRRF